MTGLPNHPGTISFIEGDSETIEDAEKVPASIRFAPSKDGKLLPVVRIVASTEGTRRTLREYGTDGTLLRFTVQTRKP